MGRKFDGDMHEEFTDADRNSIRFIGNKIYSVQTCRVTTPPTTYSGSATRSTLVHTRTLCYVPLLLKVPNHIGMQGLLEFIMPMFGPSTQQFEMAETRGA